MSLYLSFSRRPSIRLGYEAKLARVKHNRKKTKLVLTVVGYKFGPMHLETESLEGAVEDLQTTRIFRARAGSGIIEHLYVLRPGTRVYYYFGLAADYDASDSSGNPVTINTGD